MIVRLHETKNGLIVCAVDKELIGNLFEEDEKQLDLRSEFYKGKEIPSEETRDLIRNSYGLNLVGEKVVKLAIEEGVIDEDMVKRIKNIPYYQGTIDII